METICSSHKSLYRDLPFYEDHEIRRAAAGEPTLLELRLFDRSVWSSRKAEIWVWPYYLVMVTVSDYGNYVTVASRQVLLS